MLRTPKNTSIRFIILFLGALFIQSNIWFSIYSFTDIGEWAAGVATISHGALPGLWSPLPVHPGATFLFPAAFLSQLGIPPYVSVQFWMMFLVSGLVTIISYICYLLRPASSWWFFVALLLLLNVRVLDMTAPSAIAALLSTLFVLAILYIRENDALEPKTFALAGICCGALLATRIDTGAVFLLVTIPYVWTFARKQILVLCAFVALYFCALDIFFWVNPFEHFAATIYEAYTFHLTTLTFHYNHHVLILPFLGFFLAIAYYFFRPRPALLPRSFLLWLIASSCIICAVLLASPFHPARFFFPLMTIWETFLPLFLLELLYAIPIKLPSSPFSREFLIFIPIFLYRFPPVLFLMIQNVILHKW